MPSRAKPWWWALGGIIALRMLGMALIPLADTSEPRYAEIARLMAASGDWITPWFSPGVPFWGKPPLAFWAQALSFKLFGIHEFAVRLPSMLATLGTLAPLYLLARSQFGGREARWAAILYVTSALAFVASGAVLTDPFLALATTWAMTSFALAAKEGRRRWGHGFFVALAAGLLAKGPLALVLVAGALIPWLVIYPSARRSLRSLPWFTGLASMIALSLPWYILAELKTPGFLHYFLVGEHFLRFVDPGWTGDLYGSAHDRARGTIWAYALLAGFPWSLLAFFMLLRSLTSARRVRLLGALRDPAAGYLLAWTLFPLAFFSFAGNILWTYALPSLAPFSILMAARLTRCERAWKAGRLKLYTLASLVPLVLLGCTALAALQPQSLKTEKELVAYAERHMRGNERLAFLGKRPFSARFYSSGRAGLLTLEDLKAMPHRTAGLYLAVPKAAFASTAESLDASLPIEFESRRYILTVLPPERLNSRIRPEAAVRGKLYEADRNE